MIPDIALSAVERTEEAERLFSRAADGETVELTALSGMQLCVLGGPKHVLCEERVAVDWEKLGARGRRKANESMTEGMVKAGLLARAESGADELVLAPGLAVAMAARCRPTFLVVTEIANRPIRTPRLYALGDESNLVRGIVVEEPAAVPAAAGDLRQLKKMGALGWLYRYTLMSQDKAADLLAQWAIAPLPARADNDPWCPRTTSLYRRSLKPEHMGVRIITEGDGTTATLFLPEGETEVRVAATLDRAGLREKMAGLLAEGPR